jgi:multiple sugar transport system substrate-binding protein
MVNWWGDHGKDAQDPENSTIKGKIAFHLTPGSKEVYNQKTKAWVSMPQASYAPYLGFNGRCFGVASTAKNVPQCWEFLKFACSPETTLKVSYTPLAGMEPVRNSQLDVNAWVNSPFKWETREAESWLNTIKENINHPNVVADLRLPGWAEYQDSLETAVSAAVSGEMPIKEALNQAAQGWNEVTDRVGGKEQQMRFYRDIAVGG